MLDLFLDLIEEPVEFAVNFKQGIVLCYRCHEGLLHLQKRTKPSR